MAGLYNGHLIEFPQIRVDCFTSSPVPPKPPWLLPSPVGPQPAPNAQLFLLTHVHTDHLTGLSDSFTGHIVCSPDTKRMLLRLEAEVTRQDLHVGVLEHRRCKYEGLRAKVVHKGTKAERIVDRIEAVPYGVPREYELGYDNGRPVRVTITLLEANHCPGSAMFLVTSADKAVLHTGDVRCDALFMQSLRRNPAIQQFIAAPTGAMTSSKAHGASGLRVLDRIYLDTGAMLGTGDMPDREPVLQDLLRQMSLYPPDTVFFLNVWCFGWEDVVKEVARHFDQPVHVDRYKRSIYAAVKSDPFLLACTTSDPHVTRFHACERRFKCEACRTFDKQGRRVWNADRRVVHVNMVEVKAAGWDLLHRDFVEKLGRAALGEGPWPFNIDCPIARHSPLPELQSLVKMFRPRAISPNTLVPQAQGIDYFLLPELFGDRLHVGGYETVVAERNEYFQHRFGSAYLEELEQLSKAGVELLPDLGGSERDEYLPEPQIRSSGLESPVAFGRRAGTANQLDCLGLPSTSIGGGPLVLSVPKRELDEYDTDDESPRRKRLVVAAEVDRDESSLSVKVESETSPLQTISSYASHRPPAEIKPDTRSPANIKSDTWSEFRTSVKRQTTPRFVVDKEHLRALAMVCDEPGDV